VCQQVAVKATKLILKECIPAAWPNFASKKCLSYTCINHNLDICLLPSYIRRGVSFRGCN